MNRQQNLSDTEDSKTDERLHLSIESTQLSLERTHLSWVRTVIAMITAGVAIDKGLQALHKARLESGEAWFQTGHAAGLILTISGTVLLLMSSTNYIIRMKQLARMSDKKTSVFAPGILLAILIFMICILFVYIVSTTPVS